MIFSSLTALAYIDPGAGSLLLQLLLAGLLGTAAFFRRSIASFFRLFSSRKETKEKPSTVDAGD